MSRVCMGGTFDALHAGHEALLETAFREGDEGVFIGVTTDAMAAARRERRVRPYDERVADLEALLDARGWRARAEVAPISDPVGRALQPRFDTLVVSAETAHAAEPINAAREREGLPPLRVVVAPLVLAEDGRRVSATRIRRGEIDREGRLLRPLRVAVGSANPVKVEAVRRALARARNGKADVRGHGVESGVPEQPRGGETARGAIARARAALAADPDADWGVGVEAGLLEDATLQDVLDVQYCAVVDRGHRWSLGHGPGFQYPPAVVDAVEAGATVGEAMAQVAGESDIGRKAGARSEDAEQPRDSARRLGETVGAIGHLTHGAYDRTELTEAAVVMALVPRLNPRLYRLEPGEPPGAGDAGGARDGGP